MGLVAGAPHQVGCLDGVGPLASVRQGLAVGCVGGRVDLVNLNRMTAAQEAVKEIRENLGHNRVQL